MVFSSEVGLQLLFCPLGSNVSRIACCSIGTVLPVYRTFKAIETKDQKEREKWLLYWAVYGSFGVAEAFADRIISWVPLYHQLKFAFLVWLQLPTTDGARQLYTVYLRPFFSRHQARMDQIVELLYGEMGKFISTHQAGFEFMRKTLLKIVTGAFQMLRNVIHPEPRSSTRSIQGPERPISDSDVNSDEETVDHI